MDKPINFIAFSVWNELAALLKGFGYCRQLANFQVEPEFRRLFYNSEHGVVTIEMIRSQFPNLPNNFFELPEVQDAFKARFKDQKIDLVDMGNLLCFFFWVRGTETDLQRLQTWQLANV